MGQILFLIFLTIGMGSGTAFGSTQIPTTPASLKPEAVAVLALQPDPERAKMNASYRPAPSQTITLNPVANQADKEDSDWRYLSTLLTTLVLIGVIAVRRHTAGNS